jgi:tetratricopeptide (TPR) repeat protein
VRFFERAIKYDDTMIQAHKEYGVALAALGQKDKAQAELDALKARAAKCGESCAEAPALKDAIAAIATQMGVPQARIETAPSLMFASAQGGDQAYLDAVALINEHRYEDAIASLHRAEKAFGPHPDVLTYLGFANRKLKRYDIAESYYLAALRIAPNHRGATEYYGELMVERGDFAGAKVKLAALDKVCSFGCYEAEELRRWIASGHGSSS